MEYFTFIVMLAGKTDGPYIKYSTVLAPDQEKATAKCLKRWENDRYSVLGILRVA